MSGIKLHREPFRGGQFCGHQMSHDVYNPEFCPERKEEGLRACRVHDRELREEYGAVRWALGNAPGDPDEPLVLLWEPQEDAGAVEPTTEELERYRPVLDQR